MVYVNDRAAKLPSGHKKKGVISVFIKKLFPNGFASLTGFLLIALLMVAAGPMAGALTVQADHATDAQRAALEMQVEQARLQQELARQQAALEALRGAYQASGTTFDVSAIPESTLLLANRIRQHAPLDQRSALAAAVYAKRFNLNPSLLLAVISKESNFNQFTVGSHRDRGFMQIIPGTERFLARQFGAQLSLKYNPKQIFEPEYNIGFGAAYLGSMKDRYGDLHRVLTEYNRGEGGANKYFRRNSTYSTTYSRAVLELEQRYISLN